MASREERVLGELKIGACIAVGMALFLFGAELRILAWLCLIPAAYLWLKIRSISEDLRRKELVKKHRPDPDSELEKQSIHALESLYDATIEGCPWKPTPYEYLRIDLSDSKITDTDLIHLNGIRKSKLDEVNLDNTAITDNGLVRLKGLPHVRELHLGRTQITDAGLVYLHGLPSLQDLDLDGATITDAGLAHLGSFSQVENLCLQDTKITDVGLVHLQKITNLRNLSLACTQITDAGLAHLRVLKKLNRLNLVVTQVTDAGVAELQKALPNCKIHH